METRMRFQPEDDAAFATRRDELGEQFADWLNIHGVALDRWQAVDVEEFLFEGCTRTLSATPEHCAGIPASVAAFVEFLAHQGLLAGGDPPSRIRAYCESSRDRFVREMGDPANFGMAKGLFATAGGSEPGAVESAADLDALMTRLTGLPPARSTTSRSRSETARHVDRHLRHLTALGLVDVQERELAICPDCDDLHPRGGRVELTPIGWHTAVSLARDGGLEIVERPDPATADAVAIVDLAGEIDEQEWLRDVGKWFAARPDPAEAASELAAAAFDGRRPTIR